MPTNCLLTGVLAATALFGTLGPDRAEEARCFGGYARPQPLARSRIFGLFTLPKIVGDNQDLAKQLFTLHRWTGFLVILLALMHVGAALYHYFIRKDEVLKRMLPEAMGGFPAPLSPQGRTE